MAQLFIVPTDVVSSIDDYYFYDLTPAQLSAVTTYIEENYPEIEKGDVIRMGEKETGERNTGTLIWSGFEAQEMPCDQDDYGNLTIEYQVKDESYPGSEDEHYSPNWWTVHLWSPYWWPSDKIRSQCIENIKQHSDGQISTTFNFLSEVWTLEPDKYLFSCKDGKYKDLENDTEIDINTIKEWLLTLPYQTHDKHDRKCYISPPVQKEAPDPSDICY